MAVAYFRNLTADRCMPSETFVTLGTHLAGRGWCDDDIDVVLGADFVRVARRTRPRAVSG